MRKATRAKEQGTESLTGETVLLEELVVTIADLFGVLGGQVVHFDANALDRGLGRLGQVRLALALQVAEPLLEVVVGGADGPPQPLERVLDVPLDDLARLGADVARLDHLLGRLGVLGQLLARVARELGPFQLHRQVVHDLLVHRHGHLGLALAREQRVAARVHHLAFQQPPVERVLGRVHRCKETETSPHIETNTLSLSNLLSNGTSPGRPGAV